MRAARFLCGPAILSLFLAAPAEAASPDSTIASGSAAENPDSIAAERDSILVIHLEKGDSLVVPYLSAWPGDMVRYRTDDGRVGYLGFNRIRDIRDPEGDD